MDFFFSEKSSSNLKSLERLGLSRNVSKDITYDSKNVSNSNNE